MEKFSSHSESETETVGEKKRGLIERLGKLVKRNRGVAIFVLASEMALGTSFWLQDRKEVSLKADATTVTMASDYGRHEGYFVLTDAEARMDYKLKEEIGENSVIEIEMLDSVKNDVDRARYIAENDKGSLRVEGFENSVEHRYGASNEDMKAIIESMPKMYQVDAPAVRYEDKEKTEALAKYGQRRSEWAKIAYHSPSENEIVFTSTIKSDFLLAAETILHEEAHSKDWKTNKALTVDERMELIQEVIDRVNAPDRYRSSYVESIHNPNPKENLRIKTEEYYAELTMAYFLPDKYKLLSQKDKDIIGGVIHETDPSFKESDREKVWGAISKREHIHEEMRHKEELSAQAAIKAWQAGEKTRQVAEKAESEKFEKFAREKYKKLGIPYDSNPQ